MRTMRRDSGTSDGNQQQQYVGREVGGTEPDWDVRERRQRAMQQRTESERSSAENRGYQDAGRSYEEARGWDREGFVGRPREGSQGREEQAHIRTRDDSSLHSREQPIGERGTQLRGSSEERHDHVGEHQVGGTLMDRFRRWRHGSAKARDLMTRQIRGVRPNDTVQHIAQVMVEEDTGVVPVLGEGNRLLGIVTDRDIVCRLILRVGDVRGVRAADVMTRDIDCVTEQTSVYGVLRVMRERQVRRVPVVARGDRLVGIISMADIAREADTDDELQNTFEEVSMDRGYWKAQR